VVACQIIFAVSSKDLKFFDFTLLPPPGASGFRRTLQENFQPPCNAHHAHVSGLAQAAPWLPSVRQRDTFIPPADVNHQGGRLLFARSLFDSMISALPAYGMEIARTSLGKVRLPHLKIARPGGFREKNRSHA
jgi:hypothetical protein